MIWTLGHLKKASLCTLHPLGMRTSVRLEQPAKARILISITESGMEMFVRQEQPEKALLPITVTDGGMMVFLHPLISVLLAVWIMALQPPLES